MMNEYNIKMKPIANNPQRMDTGSCMRLAMHTCNSWKSACSKYVNYGNILLSIQK